MKIKQLPHPNRFIFALVALCLAGFGTQAQQPGETLVFGTGSEPDTLDHTCTSSSIADMQYKTLFDTLVFWAPDQEFYPYLATGWEISEDFSEYTFTLRDDVTFHDGTPFNAEAVKVNLDRIGAGEELCPIGGVAQSRLGALYDTTEVVDEFTVTVKFTAPNPAFLTAAADLYFTSLAAFDTYGEDIGRHAVGTGPFMLHEWQEQNSLTVIRNPDYQWPPANAGHSGHSGPPRLAEITWLFIPEETTRYASLEAGETHLINRVELEQFELLEANPDLVSQRSPLPGTPTGLMVNASLPPLDDIRVRQALMHGVDRETLVSVLFGDFYIPAYGPLSAATWSYWPGVEEFYPYDTERATELLEEAGWADNTGDGFLDKDGERLVITLMELTGTADRSEAWQFIQAQLRALGIEVQLRFAESGVVVSECHGGTQHLCGLRIRLTDPSRLEFMFAGHNVGSGFNWTHLPDGEIDDLLIAGASEIDFERREEIYHDLQRRIMELAIWLPVWDTQMVHAATPALQDWVMLPNPEYIWLYEAHFEE